MAPDIFFRMWKGSTRRRSGTSVSNNYLSKKTKKEDFDGRTPPSDSIVYYRKSSALPNTNKPPVVSVRLRDRSQVIFLTSFKVELL